MAIEIVSTTDSKEDVSHAKAMYSKKPVEEKSEKVVEKSTDKTAEASDALGKEISEPEEIEGDDVDETEDDKEDSIAKPKKKGGFQKRIDKLTKERESFKREADLWKEQAMKAGQKPAEEPKKLEAKVEVSKEGKPDPDKFNTLGEYYEALADWKYDQRQKQSDKAKHVETVKSAYENKVKSFQDKSKEFVKTAPDFFDTLAEVDHIPLNPALEDLLLRSKNGHELLYDLVKEPEEYERISKLDPTDVAYEMGLRGAKFVKAPSSVETIETKTTKAPPPVKPIGKSTTVSTKDPGEMTMPEYKEWYKRNFGGR